MKDQEKSPVASRRFTIEGPCYGKAAVCGAILRGLPEWFGIEAAILQYEAEIDGLPTFLAVRVGEVTGFLTLKRHFAAAAEVLAMGVRREAHRQGLGRALLERAQEWLKEEGVEYLQVKTLGPSRADEGYARTRAFYQAMGFQPMEEFDQIWDKDNPCLILVKKL